MKSKGMIAVLLGLALTLTACAEPIEGVIIEKDYDPGKTVTYTDTERYSCGTESYVTTTGSGDSRRTVTRSRTKYCKRPVQRTRYEQPDWDVTIQADDGETREVEVSELTYRGLRMGQRVNSEYLK